MVGLFSATEHRIQGTLTYPQEFDGVRPTDMTDQKVVVYTKVLFFKMKLGEFQTDQLGNFDFTYSMRHIPFTSEHELIMDLVRERMPYKGLFSRLIDDEQVLDEQRVTVNNKEPNMIGLNLQGCILEYLEDRPGLHVREGDKSVFEKANPRFLWSVIKAGWDEIIGRTLGKLARRIGFGANSVADIEARYNMKDESLRRTPEYTIELLLNGIYPCNWLKTDCENELEVDIHWDNYGRDDHNPCLPDARLRVRRENDQLEVIEVEIRLRPEEESIIVGPDDDDFEYALGVFNCSAIIKGEVVSHLGMGHIWTEQAAMAVFRHIRPNTPLGRLLHPHLQDVFVINNLGATAIFGPDGVLNVAGLTVEGISQSLDDVLAGMDYSHYLPRAPLVSGDRFSKAKMVYWGVVERVVERVFAEESEGIAAQSHQIFNMSEDLVMHSRPFKPWNGVQDHSRWLDGSEVASREDRGRARFQGEVRSVHPIVDRQGTIQIERLKQFCKYSLFMATFWHTWIHNSQERWVTNLEFASLAPRDDARGPHFKTSLNDADHQLSVATLLMDFDPITIQENSDHNIMQIMLEELAEAEPELDALGFPAAEVMRSVMI